MEHAHTLAELIADTAATNGGKAAVIFQDQPISYAQLNEQIERAANALTARGIAHGDRVALMLPNTPHFIIAYYAILRLGAVVVPLNVLYKADEVGYMLADSAAKVIIIYDAFLPQAGAGIKDAPSVRETIVVGQTPVPEGMTPWHALVDGTAPQRPPNAVQPGDLAVICYTSGT
ncbi:MAG: AMP-binding protein, partial [Thermomicrobiales bacterium]